MMPKMMPKVIPKSSQDADREKEANSFVIFGSLLWNWTNQTRELKWTQCNAMQHRQTHEELEEPEREKSLLLQVPFAQLHVALEFLCCCCASQCLADQH